MGERIAKGTPVPRWVAVDGSTDGFIPLTTRPIAGTGRIAALMLNRARMTLLLLSALSAQIVPACGRSYRPADRNLARSSPASAPGLVQPDVPRHLADLLVVERIPGELQRQLDLAVMVALVPHHVLQQQD